MNFHQGPPMKPFRPSRNAFRLALLASIALLLFCDWKSDEIEFIFVVLLSLAAAIGFFMPRSGWYGGALIGASIPIAHFVSRWSDRLAPPGYHKHPPNAEHWKAALILIAVGVMAGIVGAWARPRVETSI